MKIETVNAALSPVLNKLPISESGKEKIIQSAHKVCQFVATNKTKIFFGATVLFSLLATASPLTNVPIGVMVVSGALTTCLLQAWAILFGIKDFSDQSTQDKFDVLLGGVNLCTWYLEPRAAVATALFCTGMQAASLAFRYVFEVKPPAVPVAQTDGVIQN